MRCHQKVGQVGRHNLSLCGEMRNVGHWMANFIRLMNVLVIIEISAQLKPYGIGGLATELKMIVCWIMQGKSLHT